jgi:opacity protein-like surface antigen
VGKRAMVLGLLAALVALDLMLTANAQAHAATTFTVNLIGDQLDFSGSASKVSLRGSRRFGE